VKRCPFCAREFPQSVDVCPRDGTRLRAESPVQGRPAGEAETTIVAGGEPLGDPAPPRVPTAAPEKIQGREGTRASARGSGVDARGSESGGSQWPGPVDRPPSGSAADDRVLPTRARWDYPDLDRSAGRGRRLVWTIVTGLTSLAAVGLMVMLVRKVDVEGPPAPAGQAVTLDRSASSDLAGVSDEPAAPTSDQPVPSTPSVVVPSDRPIPASPESATTSSPVQSVTVDPAERSPATRGVRDRPVTAAERQATTPAPASPSPAARPPRDRGRDSAPASARVTGTVTAVGPRTAATRPESLSVGAIRGAVEQRLRAGGFPGDGAPSKQRISVNVEPGGKVTLRGVVGTRQDRDRAVRLAREVGGVSEVRAKINVRESWKARSP
jgi:hypothetical protein